LRTMYVFLPVHFFRSFEASFAENIMMLNVNFLVDSPLSPSPVAEGLFSEAMAEKSCIYLGTYSLVSLLVPLVVPVFFSTLPCSTYSRWTPGSPGGFGGLHLESTRIL